MIDAEPMKYLTYKDGDYKAKADVCRTDDTNIVVLVKPESYERAVMVTFSRYSGKALSEELPGVLTQQFWEGKTNFKIRPETA